VPETKLERLVLVLGLCAVAGLGFLVVRGKHHDARASAPPATASTSSATASETGAESPAQAPGQLAHLELTAAGGDCWTVVRSRSAHGKVIFVGVIGRGTTKRFTGASLWFRLGAAGNVTGRLNGTKLALPGGTPTILATADGIRVLVPH
jgi:RodZ C-terminal domain